VLDVAVGLEFGDVLVEEGLEFLGVFVVEDDGVRQQAVADGVARGARLALVGDGAAGVGAVLLRRELAFLGRHAGERIGHGVRWGEGAGVDGVDFWGIFFGVMVLPVHGVCIAYTQTAC
jgi:hypothetical protein